MKKMFFLAIAALGMTLASCNKEAKSADAEGDSTAVEAVEGDAEVEIESANVGGGVAGKAAQYAEDILKAGLSNKEAEVNRIEAELKSWAAGLTPAEREEASQAMVATIGENYDALIDFGIDEAIKEDPNAASMGRDALKEVMKTMMPKEKFVEMMQTLLKEEIEKQG